MTSKYFLGKLILLTALLSGAGLKATPVFADSCILVADWTETNWGGTGIDRQYTTVQCHGDQGYYTQNSINDYIGNDLVENNSITKTGFN